MNPAMLFPCSNRARTGSLPLLRRRPIGAPRRDEPDVARATRREVFFFAGALRGFFELFFGLIFASLFGRRFSCANQSPWHSHISQCDDSQLRLPSSKSNVSHLNAARRREFVNARLPKISGFIKSIPCFALFVMLFWSSPLEVFINHGRGRTAMDLS